MGDAFKCKNCGTVVETLQRCPSCGEAAMRPIQSSGDDDVIADITEPGATAGETDGESSEPAAPDGSLEPAPEEAETSPNADDAEPADTADPGTASGRRDTTGRESGSESGLLSWLKSLF
ncbi:MULTISPECIES: FmdB family zinc ribbon protein [Haloarcula]|uniref:FmdB family zinc ribbon protein n=1 Tax=Haloarcula TaxID=2237 RepID=UPI0023E825D2|nr:hypothetical protein [Halomicroarcula sp. SHR3]